MHTAASLGDALIIECLYNHKADANILDNKERTALHLAAEKGKIQAVSYHSNCGEKCKLSTALSSARKSNIRGSFLCNIVIVYCLIILIGLLSELFLF